jgi:hypothetical protein
MNEMDNLTRFRDTVPLGVTPRSERLFRAALRAEQYSERPVVPRRRNRLARIGLPWRLGLGVSAVAALVAGVMVAVLPSSPVVLTVRLLADRASAAALAQPTVNPGQWVYRVAEWNRPHTPKGVPGIGSEAGWETADGQVTYGNNYSEGVGAGAGFPSYSQLGSLPANPAALDAYLAHLTYPHSNPGPRINGLSAFFSIESMLSEYVLPPALAAEFYQALAVIPGIKVDSHVTAIDGQPGVAFVLPPTPQSEKLEIILDASNYRFLAQGSWGSGGSFFETAVARMVIVGAPGSTRPSLAPPTAAELLAERADQAVSWVSGPRPNAGPGAWVVRELATSSGDHTVWATGDDSKQASYVDGKLRVCSRSAACAKSTQWLMPAGPSYTLVNPSIPRGRPSIKHLPPTLPQSLSQLLAKLNTYRTGCADVAGDCNAVNAMANIIAGYANRGGPRGDWFLMLADIPGVTVQRVTDVTGQADVAFRFPFTNGVTEILLNARTHKFVGYVRDGIETVITKEVAVSGPGSRTPVVFHPRFATLPRLH